MTTFNSLQQMSHYIWEGVARIFSPVDDEYPMSGIQPFTGELYEE